MKKVFAFIIDLMFIGLLNNIICFIVLIGLVFFVSADTYSIIQSGIGKFMLIVALALYLSLTNKLLGNTLGRKILGVKEKYSMKYSICSHVIRSKTEEVSFPDERLKKNSILEVEPKDGFWDCPSCGARSLEIYDVCKKCGQEVSKQRG